MTMRRRRPLYSLLPGLLVIVFAGTVAHAAEPETLDAITLPGVRDLFAPETPLPSLAVADTSPPVRLFDAAGSLAMTTDVKGVTPKHAPSVAWRPLFVQTVASLIVDHAFRATFEDGTWAETKRGIFWDDYVASVKTLCCWDDGDRWTTNWLFHPMLGSFAAFVFANNHEDSKHSRPGPSSVYWSAKAKQLAYSTVYSTYFELGPVLSECAIGNVGLTPGQQTWHDIVVTPLLGTGFSIAEDLLRYHIIEKVDRKNHAWGITLGLLLNPTRSVANLFAMKAPWSGPDGMKGQ